MNILKKLTKKDLKLNKKRTIGTLIGIILATALITAVGGLAITIKNSALEMTKNNFGYYHIILFDISDKQVEELKNNNDYKHYEVVNYISVPSVTNDYINIYSMNKESFSYLKNKIIKGEFPKNENEVLIGEDIANNSKYQLGDEIKIKIKNETKQEENLTSELEEKEYKFIVSGIFTSYNFSESALITTNLNTIQKSMALTLKNPKNCKKDFEELLGFNPYKNEQTANSKYDYNINKDILKWEVGAFGDSTTKLLYGLIGVAITVILVTSVFSVKNSFAISTTEKIRTYGMLSSIGATQKQIKKMVLYEAKSLGLTGIIIGCSLGTSTIYLLTKIVNSILKHAGMISKEIPLVYKFSIIPIILAIAVGIIMIFLSIISIANKVSKVSPIQNIINTDNLKNEKTKLTTPKYIKKIFKIGGVLSYKNLKRNKRKYRVTIISLIISVFTFITASTFLEYGLKLVEEEYTSQSYNIIITPKKDNENEMINDITLNKITRLEEAYINYTPKDESVRYVLEDTSKIKFDKKIVPICVEYKDMNSSECLKKINGVLIDTYIIDADTFKKYANKIGADYTDIKDKAILINSESWIENKKTIYEELTNYKYNDEIKFKNINSSTTYTYKIGAITDKKTFGLEDESKFGFGLMLILNKEYVTEEVEINEILLNAKNPEEVVQELKKIDNIYFFNKAERVKNTKILILILSILIYGLITVITLIGLTSVFNTITSNIQLRQKDFATLKSIGMTKKEFNRMVTLESLFYSSKSLLIGISLGLIGSYSIYKIVSMKIEYGYILPVKSIIISILFITIVVFIIMKYSISKINKQNIIETIRKDNI